MSVPYLVKWHSRNVVQVELDFAEVGKEYHFLLTSDAHLDNLHCNQRMFREHLNKAYEEGAGIIDNGDLFCAMQGKFDPRSDQSQIRPEHRGNEYLDKLVDTATDFLSPAAKNIIALGHGNHETNVVNRHGVDLTERLCAQLKAKDDSPARPHWFAGWVIFQCRRGKQRQKILLYRHHGAGGGAPVTRGVIQTNRVAVQYPDADICILGHNHESYIVEVPRKRITQTGKIYDDFQTHIRIPGYKEAIGDGAEGWENVKQHGVKTQGAAWLTIRRGNRRHDQRFTYEVRSLH